MTIDGFPDAPARGTPASRPEPGAAETRVTAFVAAESLTGRTNVTSNVAWLLARAGRRVLVVDAGRGAVRVHEHLSPFYSGESPLTDHLPRGLTDLMFALPGFTAGQPTLRRYAAPAGHLDVVWVPESATWPPVTEIGGGLGGTIRSELRRQLRFIEYDDVLLDPADFSETVAQWLAVLCDALVVCFPYRAPRLADAAAVARQVHRGAPAGIRIIAATTQSAPADAVAARRHADDVASSFRGALDEPAVGVDFWQVAIPGGPEGQPLAPLLEESPHRASVLAAYGQLLSLLTQGELDRAEPEAEPVRARYRFGLGRPLAENVGELFVATPERQRPWADWLSAELTELDIRVRPWRPRGPALDGPATVLAVAPDPTALRAGGPGVEDDDEAWLDALTREVAARPGTELLVLRTVPAGPPPAGRPVDLFDCDEPEARRRLRAALGLAALKPSPLDRPWRVGFPGRDDQSRKTFGLPDRPRLFVGRDRELGELRDALLANPGGQPVWVRGPLAAGKSTLAREYVARFHRDYRLVVWIPAGSRHAVRTALAALADTLGVEPSGNAVHEMLAELRKRGDQWLLVYDGVGDPADLVGLLPSGRGHVVVTGGTGDQPVYGPSVAVDGLRHDDATGLLIRQVPGLSAAPAAAVVDAVGTFPLDLRLASGLLGQAGILLDKREAVTGSRGPDAAVPAFLEAIRPTGDGASPTRRIVRVALRLMDEEFSGRVAVMLTEMYAFAAPIGMSLALVQSRRMRGQVAADLADEDAALLRADGWEMDRALALGMRFRLFEVGWGRDGRVRMHPAVQATVLADMTAGKHAARRRRFLLALAGAAPRTIAAASELRHELHQHLLSSGALDADGPDDVRRLVVEQLEHLIARGEDEAAEAHRLWRPVLDRWLAAYGWQDRITLRLATRLADVTRSLGHSDESLTLSRQVLRESTVLLGHDHPRVLVTRRGLAGDLRGLGRFRPALIEDQATWRGFRDQFGNSHPETLVAAHNLAQSYYLAGRTDEAVRVARETLARRRRLFAEDHPDTLELASDLGRYLGDLGDLASARKLLQEAYQERLPAGRNGEEDTLLLRIIRHLAVIARRQEELTRAKELNSRAYLALRRLLSEDNPRTQSCRLSLAVDYHLGGESEHAVRLADESLAGYRRDLPPEHPFTQVCLSLRGVLLRGVGDLEEAVSAGRQAATGLAATLGESHPWTLGGQVNLAGSLAAAQRTTEAERLLRGVLDEGRHFLGLQHPYLRATRRLLAALVTDGEISGGIPYGPAKLDFVDMEVPAT
ncbi:FxSxx-COOH system tetratricopeptide repeat protein [Micromonospora sp. NPDC051141]|uniref:FxSxx-COOH system tetratricopeptide repeat protein n=1 Tax=Micromonospora sp. NPDC051141 TaxID=3364284 RepID=UPI00379E8041